MTNEKDVSELALTLIAGSAIETAVIADRIIQRLRLNKIPDKSTQPINQVRKVLIEIRNNTNPFHLKQANIILDSQSNWERVKIYLEKLIVATNDVCNLTETLIDEFGITQKQEVQADILVIKKLAQEAQEIIGKNSE